MINKTWLVLILFAGIIIGSLGTERVLANSEYRFEHIYTQIIRSKVEDTHVDIDLEVIHDRETGQEIVCSTDADRYTGVACYLTGRNWK